jgi:hypothetical protein|tara:strand:+ start:336 stop:650 length:315 start_codon:yes stop_codon:yes gene_type:complete
MWWLYLKAFKNIIEPTFVYRFVVGLTIDTVKFMGKVPMIVGTLSKFTYKNMKLAPNKAQVYYENMKQNMTTEMIQGGVNKMIENIHNEKLILEQDLLKKRYKME